ncbi:MAG: glycine cleavage system protein GcvH [Burkholderiaceae bacterium]|jgi:glycine cleavage system H protein|uniref:glycine cleavage system protein GcvH n=1 Tax=Polynucleobacter sp. MWH-Loch1C5 TaxID=2689108 RepID=UPI001C0AF56E|nr:glycine cleavage system protein GcvH [Polynucleobacter sp. MWH-Loch1C5]MBU3542444.1 glycine cleavage system protein GcvH [Polynucleobacter sp. MWH-Loch1C5]NBV01065.1 glycine cleavage system protein GcvH [Burkholderiaceae bacterium]
MNLPQELRYTESHEWVRAEADGTITVGITDHAQEALGDIVFLELPESGKKLGAGDACAVVESVKAASDIYAPVAGEIIASNNDVTSTPEQVNSDAYGSWLFKIKPNNPADVESLLNAAAYGKLIGA